MDRANGPSMAQIVGRERNLIAAELPIHQLTNPAQRRLVQIGGDGGQQYLSQIKLLDPLGIKRPDAVAARLGHRQYLNHGLGFGRLGTRTHN